MYRNGNNGRRVSEAPLIGRTEQRDYFLSFFSFIRLFFFFYISIILPFFALPLLILSDGFFCKGFFSASVVPRSHFRLLSFAKTENASLRYSNRTFHSG